MGLLFMKGSPLNREGPSPLFQDAERGNGDSPKARAGGENNSPDLQRYDVLLGSEVPDVG